MRKLFFLLTALFSVCFLHAQDLNDIRLKEPHRTGGTPFMQVLADRHSVREFDSRPLTNQDLSDLLWAANGVNRADGKRTAPSALNKQDIDIYVILAEGAYLYDSPKNVLKAIAAGDFRPAVAGGQDFVKTAPVCLVLVSDLSRFGAVSDQTKAMAAMDAGIVCQNINLFCASAGLSTVPRATMDKTALKTALKLSDSQLPLMNNPVGYPKK